LAVLEIARRSGEAFPYQDEREGEGQREEGARGDDQQAREMHWEYTVYARTYQNEGFANIPNAALPDTSETKGILALE